MRALAGNLLVAGLSILFGLGVLEVAARIILWSRPPGKSGEQAAYTIFDPILGWRNKPGASVEYNRREYRTSVRINTLGFRDVERARTKPADRGRVLVLGDSFVEAYGVELEEGFTRRLEAIAGEAGCPVDVVNAGVHGYSTDQEALWYEREGKDLGADVTIIAPYYNDFVHNVRDRYSGSIKPLVEVHDGVLVPVNTPLPEPPPKPANPAAPAPRPVEGSALRALVLERLLRGAPQWYARLADAGFVEAYEPDGLSDEMRVYRNRGNNPLIESAWTRTASILASLADAVRASGGKPVILHVPARFEVSDRAFDLTILRYGLDREAWDPGRVSQRLAEIAENTGFAFLDPTEALRASSGLTRGEPYFPVDGHWNRLGHDVVARELFSFLRGSSLVSCARARQ
jgi:hypothetical protein